MRTRCCLYTVEIGNRERGAAMQILGNKQVLANLIRQQRAIDEGKKAPLKIAKIMLGGGMACVRGAGVDEAIAEYAPDAADVCAAISGGAAVEFGFLSGKPKLARAIFGSLTWNDFIVRKNWSIKMKIDQVTKVLSAIGDAEVRAHRSDFLVFVTEFSTGKYRAINAKQTSDMVEVVRASMMIPGLCSGVVQLDGQQMCDGAFGMPLPIRYIAKKYRPTDILIVFNSPLPETLGWIKWHLFPLLDNLYLKFYGVPRSTRDRAAATNRVMAYELQMLTRRKASTWREFFAGIFKKTKRSLPRERSKIRWCIIAPEAHEAISHLCTDRKVVREAGKQGYEFMKKLMQEAEANLDKDK